jgi:hypothetical protein
MSEAELLIENFRRTFDCTRDEAIARIRDALSWLGNAPTPTSAYEVERDVSGDDELGIAWTKHMEDKT